MDFLRVTNCFARGVELSYMRDKKISESSSNGGCHTHHAIQKRIGVFLFKKNKLKKYMSLSIVYWKLFRTFVIH